MNKHDEFVELFKSLKEERDKKIDFIINSIVNFYISKLRGSIVKDLLTSIKMLTPSDLDEYIKEEFLLDFPVVVVKNIYTEINRILLSKDYGFKIREVNVGSPELYLDVK